jgi:Glycine zipper
MTIATRCLCVSLLTVLAASGCESASYGQRGAGLGALGGAGIGALIGHATGHTAAGALIGTGVGAVTGAVVGTSLDDIQARNRAEISARLGREVIPGGATTTEVLAMTRAGVDPQLIINYVNASGMVQPVTVQDVIYLHEQGVSSDVIQATQNPRVAQYAPQVVRVVPPRETVIIEDNAWGSPYCYPHYNFSYGCGGCGCR